MSLYILNKKGGEKMKFLIMTSPLQNGITGYFHHKSLFFGDYEIRILHKNMIPKKVAFIKKGLCIRIVAL